MRMPHDEVGEVERKTLVQRVCVPEMDLVTVELSASRARGGCLSFPCVCHPLLHSTLVLDWLTNALAFPFP